MTVKKVLLIVTLSLCLYAVLAGPKTMKASATPVFCEKSIFIAAPPDSVWARLTAINSWSHWFWKVTEARLSGELRPGTSFDWKASGVSIHSTLSVVKKNEEFAWTGRAYTINAVHNWKFKKTADGGTEVAVSESMNGLVATLFKKSLHTSLQKDMDESLLSLKHACERH